MKSIAIAFVLAAGINSCIGNILLKWNSITAPVNATLFQKVISVGFIGGLGFYAINVVLFAKSLDYMNVSVAYPILAGSGFAMLAVASYLLFGESFGLTKFLGLLLVLAGIVLLAQGA